MTAILRSLRWRLLVGTAVAVALALLAAGFVLASLFRQHVVAQFDAELLRHLDQLTAAMELDAQGQPFLRNALNDPRWQTPYAGLYWQIEKTSNAAEQHLIAVRSRSLWDAVLAVPQDSPYDGEVHRHTTLGPSGQAVRVLERTVRFEDASAGGHAPQTDWRLMVAAQTTELTLAIESFTWSLAFYLGILGAALWLAAWVQVGLGLRPLRQLQKVVQAMREGQGAHLSGAFPSEVMPLVEDFNRVLDQNQQGVQRARQLAGNLAHAIKTPLTVLGQLARQTPDPDLARQITEQVETVRRQVDWQLGRARAAGSASPGLRTPVAPLLQGLVRVMRKVHARHDGGTALDFDMVCRPAGLVFEGESQDLQEMAGNLLDNACKWASSQVQIRATLDSNRLQLTVSDDGQGLPEPLREQVMARGVRADERVSGSGLGLDIVREVASLYRGTLRLDPSDLGGLCATLTLPGSAGEVNASTGH